MPEDNRSSCNSTIVATKLIGMHTTYPYRVHSKFCTEDSKDHIEADEARCMHCNLVQHMHHRTYTKEYRVHKYHQVHKDHMEYHKIFRTLCSQFQHISVLHTTGSTASTCVRAGRREVQWFHWERERERGRETESEFLFEYF